MTNREIEVTGSTGRKAKGIINTDQAKEFKAAHGISLDAEVTKLLVDEVEGEND